MNWRYRAQRNPYGVQPLIVITKGWPYDKAYRLGADEDMRVLQEWLYNECGKTWRTYPATVIRGDSTAEEYAASNIYLDLAYQLDAHPTLHFCNSRRLYVLYSTGGTGLKNMAGRSAFGCLPRADNPLEPWGPGRAGGPSDWAMEMVAGHEFQSPFADPNIKARNACRGALIHEMLHCLGVQHSLERHPETGAVLDGPEAWLTPLGGWWLFGLPDAHLLPREIAEIRGERDVSGPYGTSPAIGSHFFR